VRSACTRAAKACLPLRRLLTARHGIFSVSKGNKEAKRVPGGRRSSFDNGTSVAKKGGSVQELDFVTGTQDAKTMNRKVVRIAKLALSRM
jgi:hypothetical protein